MSFFKSFFVLATLTVMQTTYAQGLQLGHPSTGGNGCPQGTVSTSLSPDSSELSILFDEFIAEAGPGVGKRMDRKSCNISIPVSVPQGYSVSVIGIDYRGFVGLPDRRSQAMFSAEYFFANSRGPRFQRTFRGEQFSDYFIENDLIVTAQVWSACGAQTNLRVNAAMTLMNSSRYEDAMATVDSADISSGIIYQLQWRRCF